MKIKIVKMDEDTAQTSVEDYNLNVADIGLMTDKGLYYGITLHNKTELLVTTKQYFKILDGFNTTDVVSKKNDI